MKRRTSRALHLGTKSGAGLRPTPCARSSARVAATSGASAPLSALLRSCKSREQRKPSSPARFLTRKDTHKREGNFGSSELLLSSSSSSSLLLFLTRAEVSRMCMITNAVPIGMGALDGKELFTIKGSEKLALNSGQPGGARKMRQSRRKPPPPYDCT